MNGKKQKITLGNDFHNSSAVVIAEIDERDDRRYVMLSKSQYDRARRKLCGLSQCTCGGIRGIQLGPDGRRIYVEHEINH